MSKEGLRGSDGSFRGGARRGGGGKGRGGSREAVSWVMDIHGWGMGPIHAPKIIQELSILSLGK